jgi:hypothetical protein
MERLLVQVRDLCLLRAGPQDLPFSPALFRNLLILALLVDLAYSWMVGVREGLLLVVVMAFAVGIGLVFALLSMTGRRERFLQTMTAVLLVGIVFKLALMPMIMGVLPLPQPGDAPTPLQGILAWLVLGALIWNLVVDGHILRHALEVRLAQGVLLALALMIAQLALTHVLARLLFGLPQGVAA